MENKKYCKTCLYFNNPINKTPYCNEKELGMSERLCCNSYKEKSETNIPERKADNGNK